MPGRAQGEPACAPQPAPGPAPDRRLPPCPGRPLSPRRPPAAECGARRAPALPGRAVGGRNRYSRAGEAHQHSNGGGIPGGRCRGRCAQFEAAQRAQGQAAQHAQRYSRCWGPHVSRGVLCARRRPRDGLGAPGAERRHNAERGAGRGQRCVPLLWLRTLAVVGSSAGGSRLIPPARPLTFAPAARRYPEARQCRPRCREARAARRRVWHHQAGCGHDVPQRALVCGRTGPGARVAGTCAHPGGSDGRLPPRLCAR